MSLAAFAIGPAALESPTLQPARRIARLGPNEAVKIPESVLAALLSDGLRRQGSIAR